MPKCSIRACKNNSSKVAKAQGVSFHRFPSEKTREIWVEFVRQTNGDDTWTPNNYSTICSNHFDERHIQLSTGKTKALKKGAIPMQAKEEKPDDKHTVFLELLDNPNVMETSSSDLLTEMMEMKTSHDISTHVGQVPTKVKCKLCPRYTASTDEDMICHMRKVHRGENPFQCYICEYSTYNKSGFKEHVRIHLGSKPFKCSFCPYASASKKNTKKHENIHRPDNPLKCAKCDHIARNQKSFNSHMKIKHEEIASENSEEAYVLVCGCCDKEFPNTNALDEHLDQQTRCDQCDRSVCDLAKHLDGHRTIFGKDKLELALKTTFETEDSKELNVAICDCDQAFQNEELLKDHRRIVKKCLRCNMIVCDWSKHLAMHKQAYNVAVVFSCKLCSYSTRSKMRGLLHLVHHPNQDLSDCELDLSILNKYGILSQNT